jgi:hypothetical protein
VRVPTRFFLLFFPLYFAHHIKVPVSKLASEGASTGGTTERTRLLNTPTTNPALSGGGSDDEVA